MHFTSSNVLQQFDNFASDVTINMVSALLFELIVN